MPVEINPVLETISRTLPNLDANSRQTLTSALNSMRQFAQERDTERIQLLDTHNKDQASITQLQTSVTTLQQTNAAQAKQITDLQARLAQATAPTSVATPLNVANSFKNVVDTIQTQARQTPGVATTIKTMDIEVKRLVQVQPDHTTALVLPGPGAQIDPNSLSTLRVSFGAVPVAAPATPPPGPGPAGPPPGPAREAPQPEPPALPPGRATRARRRPRNP